MELEVQEWCSRARSDGWLPEGSLRDATTARRPRQSAEELVAAGFWVRSELPPGWRTDWSGQITAAERAELNRKHRDRQAKYRSRVSSANRSAGQAARRSAASSAVAARPATPARVAERPGVAPAGVAADVPAWSALSAPVRRVVTGLLAQPGMPGPSDADLDGIAKAVEAGRWGPALSPADAALAARVWQAKAGAGVAA